MFECIWDYRFLYRDLVEILSRNRRLRLRFARILKRADEQAHAVMRGLSQAGIMRASGAELAATATNVLVIATFWLNYAAARGDKDEHEAIRAGIVQVMMLLAPFLRDAERVHLNTLTRAYWTEPCGAGRRLPGCGLRPYPGYILSLALSGVGDPVHAVS